MKKYIILAVINIIVIIGAFAFYYPKGTDTNGMIDIENINNAFSTVVFYILLGLTLIFINGFFFLIRKEL